MKITKLFITVNILTVCWLVVKATREVTCSCGVRPDDSCGDERVLSGPPGKKGPMGLPGLKGDQGMKGERGQADDTSAELERLQNKLLVLERKVENYAATSFQRNDCNDVAKQRHTANGVYTILVKGKFLDVYCDLKSDEGSWLVFQRRNSGEVDFYLGWSEYQAGFGNKSGEFWLGLDNLHAITSSGSYKLRIDLEDWEGNTAYAEYSTMTVGDSTSNYRLNIGSYSGTAGDSLTYHNNQPFTTKDNDNDNRNGSNCAVIFLGAWWLGNCLQSDLNGEYVDGGRTSGHKGIRWNHWKGGSYSMKKTEMKIQRI